MESWCRSETGCSAARAPSGRNLGVMVVVVVHFASSDVTLSVLPFSVWWTSGGCVAVRVVELR